MDGSLPPVLACTVPVCDIEWNVICSLDFKLLIAEIVYMQVFLTDG